MAEYAASKDEDVVMTDSDGGEDYNIDNSSNSSQSTVTLPPEVWANVIDYLFYDSLISCASSSQAMLHDALPLVTTLHIEKASHLRIGIVSKHLRDVQNVSICNLFSKNNNANQIQMDEDIATNSVHFLSRLPNLESVTFSGKDGDSLCSLDSEWMMHQQDTINHLLQSFAGAFDCKSIPHNLQINGLRCPKRFGRTVDCKVCKRICKKFPLERIEDIDLCLPHATSNGIIKSREGGRNYLQSETRFMQLLGKGRVYHQSSDYFSILEYQDNVQQEMQSFVEKSHMDVTKLSQEDVAKAIRKQYPNNSSVYRSEDVMKSIENRYPLHYKNTVYLSEESFDYLKSIGIPISDDLNLLDPDSVRVQNLVFARDFIKLVAMKIQKMPVPGLHHSVSIVLAHFYNGAHYIIMTNPSKVAEILGFPESRTQIRYFFNMLKEIGCIFHCLSKTTYRGYGDDDWATRQLEPGTKWVFRVCTNVAGVLTRIAFGKLKEATLGRITNPQTIQNTIRENQLPFIEYVINGWVGTAVTDQLVGDAAVKADFLAALKRQLEDSFYSNCRSFITNDPNILSKSAVYTYAETGDETTVVVRFNRGFTQDDFSD